MRLALFLLLLVSPFGAQAKSWFDLAFPELEFLHLYQPPENPGSKPKPGVPGDYVNLNASGSGKYEDIVAPLTKWAGDEAPEKADTRACQDGIDAAVAARLKEPLAIVNEIEKAYLFDFSAQEVKNLNHHVGNVRHPPEGYNSPEPFKKLTQQILNGYAADRPMRMREMWAKVNEAGKKGLVIDGVVHSFTLSVLDGELKFEFVPNGYGEKLVISRSAWREDRASVVTTVKGETKTLPITVYQGFKIPECKTSPRQAYFAAKTPEMMRKVLATRTVRGAAKAGAARPEADRGDAESKRD